MGNVDHIAIIVEDLDEVLKAYEIVAEKRADLSEEDPSMGMRSAYLKFGGMVIELMQPFGENRVTSTKGQGIHHMALRVSDLRKTLAGLKELGVRTLDEEPSSEGDDLSIFLDPRDTGGVLMELIQGGR